MCQLLWGFLLVLIGASIIFNIIFGISFPIFKVLFAGFLIYCGIRLLMPSSQKTWWTWSCCSSANGCAFEKCSSSQGDSYEVRFGKSTIDLNAYKNLTEPKTICIQVQFGQAIVILPTNVPVRVKADISFGAVHLPHAQNTSEYSNLYGAQEPVLTVLIESAFSSVFVQE